MVWPRSTSGTETHLCFRGETVLRHGFDKFIVETLMDHMKFHGPILRPGSTPASITLDARTGLRTVHFVDGSSIADVDCVLFAYFTQCSASFQCHIKFLICQDNATSKQQQSERVGVTFE
jgi:hypothetical protein